MSLTIDFIPPPGCSTGHFEQVDRRTVKWIPDTPVTYSVISATYSVTIEAFGGSNAEGITLVGS
jgi:hypothetical protein